LLIGSDLILFNVSAEAEHIGDARYCAQLQLDYPVLNRSQFLIGLASTDDFVEINLTGS
jgi:hypothetical protein